MRIILQSILIILLLNGFASSTESNSNILILSKTSSKTYTTENTRNQINLQSQLGMQDSTIDSAQIYRDLATKYAMDADHESEGQAYALLFTTYGVLATAAGIGFFAIDYKGSFFQYPGYVLGGALIGTGAIALFLDIFTLPIAIFSSPSKSWKKAEEYHKKADEWELKVKPAINFTEPGAGLLMELTF